MDSDKTKLGQKRLKEVLIYYPVSGTFRWIKKISTKNTIGAVAGCVCRNSGYVQICINKKVYKAHRLSFLYMTGKFPKNQVDHKDHNRSNNRWLNLREASNQDNSKNNSLHKNNKSGRVGVFYNSSNSKWQAQIMSSGICFFLGYFKDKSGAVKVRKAAEKKYGFHENHGKRKRVILLEAV